MQSTPKPLPYSSNTPSSLPSGNLCHSLVVKSYYLHYYVRLTYLNLCSGAPCLLLFLLSIKEDLQQVGLGDDANRFAFLSDEHGRIVFQQGGDKAEGRVLPDEGKRLAHDLGNRQLPQVNGVIRVMDALQDVLLGKGAHDFFVVHDRELGHPLLLHGLRGPRQARVA